MEPGRTVQWPWASACRLKTPTARRTRCQLSVFRDLGGFWLHGGPLPEMVTGAHTEARSGPKANTGSTPGNAVVIARVLRSNWGLILATA